MNYFIAFLLKFPLYYVLISGLVALTGLSIWWCIPICTVICLSYDIGEMVRRREL